MKLKNFTIKKYSQGLASFWLKKYKIVFVFIFFGATGFGAYLWYETFYHFSWSEEQKQQYTLTQNRSINLKENEFKNMYDMIQNRKAKFEIASETLKDIFKSE
jgi:hypothetical protein